jgi:CubicO group peptidase (beta-lactamase class C family)
MGAYTRFTLVLCLLLPGLGRSAAALEPEIFQANMEQALREEGLPGTVWAMVSPDGDRLGAAGLANADTGEPMTIDNRVHIGSVSKTVLAIGVLRLITTGRLALDTPVSDLLPKLKIDNPWASTDPVRVRHLLAHTAGLDNLRFWQAFSLEPQVHTPLAEAFSRDPALLGLRTRPGSSYSYSNMGYGLLGLVIESVTGERYEHYLDIELLQALSMHDSTFEFVSQSGVYTDPRLAMGHFELGKTHAAVTTYLRPAGQFTTTVADMAVFAHFLMGDGVIKGETFIAPALLAALDRAEGTEAALAGLFMGHGLALAGRDRHGVVGMCHPGTVVGFRAMLCLYPEQGKAFFVAMNADSETADYNRFNELLIKTLDVKAGPQHLAAVVPPPDMNQWQGFYVPAPSNMQQFAWVDRLLNFVHVNWDGDYLRLKPFQSAERELVPIGAGLFQATDRTAISHVLFVSSRGTQVISDGLRHFERAPLSSLLPQWASLAAGLLGLSWIFLTGLVRLLTAKLQRSDPVFVPLLACYALLLPIPFFFLQSFLQLGDLTVASGLLALVTGALPVAMSFGIVVYFRRRAGGALGRCDAIACFAVLQWSVVLMVGHMLPFRLWT